MFKEKAEDKVTNWTILLRMDPSDHAVHRENDDTSHQISMCQIPGTLPHSLNSFFLNSHKNSMRSVLLISSIYFIKILPFTIKETEAQRAETTSLKAIEPGPKPSLSAL